MSYELRVTGYIQQPPLCHTKGNPALLLFNVLNRPSWVKFQNSCWVSSLSLSSLWVYSSCGGGGLPCNVLYRRHSLNFQYPHRIKPLEVLTSLCVGSSPQLYGRFIPPLSGCVLNTCVNVGHIWATVNEGGCQGEHRWLHILASTKPQMAQSGSAYGWRCQIFVSLPASRSIAQVGVFFFIPYHYSCMHFNCLHC